MNREQSHLKLKNFGDKFLIVGYKPDGFRGIPVKYEWVTESAYDENDVCQKTKGLIEFKVFLIKEGPFSFDQWRKLSLKKSQEQTEKEERELFEKLKSKFEKK
jgi:hypothetical protein